jgi:diaminopimelate epimerase
MRKSNDAFLMDATGNRILVLVSSASSYCEMLNREDVVYSCSEYGAEILAHLALSDHGPHFVRFWNPDGTTEHLCGNGLRAIGTLYCAIGQDIEIRTPHCSYRIGRTGPDDSYFSVHDSCVSIRSLWEHSFSVDPGTPHQVFFVDDLFSRNVVRRGQQLSTGLRPRNATFASYSTGALRVRTFERGVGETLSCGSGALSGFAALKKLLPKLKSAEASFVSGSSLYVSLSQGGHFHVVGPCRIMAQLNSHWKYGPASARFQISSEFYPERRFTCPE